MTLVWVIGCGGLLGGALHHELSQNLATLFDPNTKFSWNNKYIASKEFEVAVNNFAMEAKQAAWKIYWAAGIGTMHSSAEALEDETYILESIVAFLLNHKTLNLKSGSFIFSSSAGAIYAGIQNDIITESTSPSPINSYGQIKLKQESAICALNKGGDGANVAICRISTLFGIKQKNGKQQGLLAEIARRTLSNQVVHIYVPLDTMRDYISAEMAAKKMIQFASMLEKRPGIYIKVIASEVSISIAQILAIIKKISKRNIKVVTQADKKSAQYQRIVQFKSEVLMPSDIHFHETSIEGLAQLLRAMQKEIAKGNT